MPNFDLIVCGAGPAGSMAAETAARGGMKVLLLEKETLPRVKPCGGGIPRRLIELIPDLPWDLLIEQRVKGMWHSIHMSDPVPGKITLPENEIFMVERSTFDHFLVQRAIKAGVSFLESARVKDIERDSHQVLVYFDRGRDTAIGVESALHCIGADGANGCCRKLSGIEFPFETAIAMETTIPWEWSSRSPFPPDVLHLEYGAVDGGYAWLFPRRNSVNIGAGVFLAAAGRKAGKWNIRSELISAIQGYQRKFGIPEPVSNSYFGHPLPLWCGKGPRNSDDGRMLLVGDAAGLIEPLFADGIRSAVVSGKIAAKAILQGRAETYTEMLDEEFSHSFDAARKVAGLFFRFPGVAFRFGIQRTGSTEVAARLLAGTLSFSELPGSTISSLVRQFTRLFWS